MLREMVEVKQLPMDSWYATTKGMKYMDEQEKIYYCPLIKVEAGYQRVEHLSWEQGEKFQLVRPRGFPTNKKVNVSTNNGEYIITNDPDSLSPEEVKEEYSKRWQVEVFYRELKQTTGGSKAQIQGNHIGCALLVWLRTSVRLLSRQ